MTRPPDYCESLESAIERLERENAALRTANAALVRWKGEIDSHLIARGVKFPPDYENSPKWAIAALLGRDEYQTNSDFEPQTIRDKPKSEWCECHHTCKGITGGAQCQGLPSASK